MKRLHVHISVESLNDSIGFYSTLFGVDPDVQESDYAKWMLDDPRVNFAISERCGRTPGVDHLGIQVEADSELEEISARLSRANRPPSPTIRAGSSSPMSRAPAPIPATGSLGSSPARRSGPEPFGLATEVGCLGTLESR